MDSKEAIPAETKIDTEVADIPSASLAADNRPETPADSGKKGFQDEDEFSDAVGERQGKYEEDADDDDDEEEGELQSGDALGLSMVIDALQGTMQQQQQQQSKDSGTAKPGVGNNDGLNIDTNTSATTSTRDDTSEPHTPVPEEQASNTTKKSDLSVQVDLLRKSLDLPSDKNMADYVTPPTPGVAPTMSTELPKELHDQDHSHANTIVLGKVDLKSVSANTMGPREQEKYGKYLLYVTPRDQLSFHLSWIDQNMLKGMQAFFNNKFSEARDIFHARSER